MATRASPPVPGLPSAYLPASSSRRLFGGVLGLVGRWSEASIAQRPHLSEPSPPCRAEPWSRRHLWHHDRGQVCRRALAAPAIGSSVLIGCGQRPAMALCQAPWRPRPGPIATAGTCPMSLRASTSWWIQSAVWPRCPVLRIVVEASRPTGAGVTCATGIRRGARLISQWWYHMSYWFWRCDRWRSRLATRGSASSP